MERGLFESALEQAFSGPKEMIKAGFPGFETL
jgi:hypothetical protein